jgi:hypothetical protein
MSDETPGTAELENLSTKELHDRAMGLAKQRRDVGFLWDLLRSIPAAAAAMGDHQRASFDMLHGLSLLEEFTHAGEGELAEALRPVYLEYLTRHGTPRSSGGS